MFEVYITNLGKYAEGEIIAKWVSLPCPDIDKELQSIGVTKNGKYTEYFITDYANDIDYQVKEYGNLYELNELAEEIEELDDCQRQELAMFIDAVESNLQTALENFENAIYYPYMDLVTIARELVENGYKNIPEYLWDYIDYDKIATDLCCNGSFYEVSNGGGWVDYHE